MATVYFIAVLNAGDYAQATFDLDAARSALPRSTITKLQDQQEALHRWVMQDFARAQRAVDEAASPGGLRSRDALAFFGALTNAALLATSRKQPDVTIMMTQKVCRVVSETAEQGARTRQELLQEMRSDPGWVPRSQTGTS